ncbi:MAG: helix-turn-helix domain-containing protein [Chloroflexota bacterium]
MKPSIELTDPRSLRALAHPTRLALVGLLRQHGTLTATQAGRLLGLNSGSASFHLRQLAKYGLVEEVGSPGRQKPWRATAQVTSWPDIAAGSEMREASRLLTGTVTELYRDLILNWLDRRAEEPVEWQQATWIGDLLLHVTAGELTALGKKIEELAAPYQQRVFDAELRPMGSRPVTVLHVALPHDTDPVESNDRP